MAGGGDDLEEVKKDIFPVAIREQLNKMINLFKRPWTVAFNNDGKNEVQDTKATVVINLSVVTLNICRNSRPRRMKVVGKLIHEDTTDE